MDNNPYGTASSKEQQDSFSERTNSLKEAKLIIDQLKIYIAGPYTADTDKGKLQNVNTAIDAAIELFRKGHFPYVSHLAHFVDKRAYEKGIHLNWEDYIRWDKPWLEVCDAVLYLGSSKGADLELQGAQEMGKKVFRSIDEVPPAL